jgi:hypothetical protein
MKCEKLPFRISENAKIITNLGEPPPFPALKIPWDFHYDNDNNSTDQHSGYPRPS